MWITIWIVIVAFSSILHKIQKASGFTSNYSLMILLCFGVFCQKSFPTKYLTRSIRYSIIFLFPTSFVIYNFYTSALVSTLVDIKPISSINDRHELENSDIPIGFCDLGRIKNVINVKTVPHPHPLNFISFSSLFCRPPMFPRKLNFTEKSSGIPVNRTNHSSINLIMVFAKFKMKNFHFFVNDPSQRALFQRFMIHTKFAIQKQFIFDEKIWSRLL